MNCKEFKTKYAEIIIQNKKWKYDLESLDISKNIVGESQASFTLTFIQNAIQPIDIGTPVNIYMEINGVRELVFGGIISNLSSNPIRNGYKAQLFLDVECEGFAILLERRNTYFYVINPITYKQCVENLISLANDDGFSTGIIEGDEQIPSDFEFEGGTFAEFLDNLADLIGYMWYVDYEQKVHFVKEYPKNNQTYDFINKGSYQLSLSSRNANNYFNKVIVQAENFHIVLEDSAEINKRKSLFGSGVYGKILREKEIKTPDDARILAQNFLEQNSFNRQEFAITTNEFIRLNNEFIIKWQGFDYTVIATELSIRQSAILPFFEYKLEYKPPLPKKLKYHYWKEEIKEIITTNSQNQKEVKSVKPKFQKIKTRDFELTKDDSEVMIIVEASYSTNRDSKGDIEVYLDGKFIGSIRTGSAGGTLTKTIQVDLKKGSHTVTAKIESLSSADISAGFLPNKLTDFEYSVYSPFLKTTTKRNERLRLTERLNSNFTDGTSKILEIDGNIYEVY